MLLVKHFTSLLVGLLKKENHILTLELTNTFNDNLLSTEGSFCWLFYDTSLDYTVLNSRMINDWKTSVVV